MSTVAINIGHCKSAEELHVALKDALCFPDYYGKNLDALWDCLSEIVAQPMTVKLLGFQTARDAIGVYVNKVLEILHQAEQEKEGFKVIVE